MTRMIRIISQIKKEIVNVVGSAVAKWVLHYDDGLIVIRKGGARQIIKVFSEPAYRNVIKPAIHKATDVIKVGDVVTDNGYHGKVVVTRIQDDLFCGYYLADGVLVSWLKSKDFKRIVSHVDLKIEGDRKHK
mgnify:CR=1 FL=1